MQNKLSDNEKHFDIRHLKVELKERALKSASITIAAQGVKLSVQITSISVLARLLEPSDFGLVAMVGVFTGLALQFMEGGLSMATIQRDSITHSQVSSLFWINAILGMALFLLSVLFAPMIAAVYDEPRLVQLMGVMGLVFLIGGLSVQHDALLRRQMRFVAISIIDVSSMLGGVLAGVAAALYGLGYWALVVSALVVMLMKTIMRWVIVRWVPSFVIKAKGLKPLLEFGGNLSGANFIGYLATNVTPFAIGYMGGSQILGVYNRASTLVAMPSSQLLPPLTSVMQPVLVRVKDDPQRLRRVALSLMTKVAIVTMLVTVVMFVSADWLILLFLGPGWDEAVDIFRLLAIATIVTPITTFTAIVMVSMGEARALMKWKVVTLFILLFSILVGSAWGVLGIVFAHCLSGLFVRMPGFLWYSTAYQPIRFKEFLCALYPIFLAAFFSILVNMVLRGVLNFESGLVSILIFSILSALVYFLILFLFNSARKELSDLLAMIREFNSR